MCSVKTMVKIAVGIAALLLAGYMIFPQSREFIAANALYLLVLACPVAMYFAMKPNNTKTQEKEKASDHKPR